MLETETADLVDLVHCDILSETDSNPRLKEYFDTVVMNPPFGTKKNEGIDMKLLSAAIKVRLVSIVIE